MDKPLASYIDHTDLETGCSGKQSQGAVRRGEEISLCERMREPHQRAALRGAARGLWRDGVLRGRFPAWGGHAGGKSIRDEARSRAGSAGSGYGYQHRTGQGPQMGCGEGRYRRGSGSLAKDRAHVKVIIEACLLTDEEKVEACRMAKEAGADFVKTSTGFSTGGATPEDVALMRRTVGPDMGVKAAGGIRDYESAMKVISAEQTVLARSNGIAIVEGEK